MLSLCMLTKTVMWQEKQKQEGWDQTGVWWRNRDKVGKKESWWEKKGERKKNKKKLVR